MIKREAKRAAVADASRMPRKYLGRNEPWQATIRRWDREGPGFVGFALDLKALVASSVELHVEERDEKGKWGRSNDPMANAALSAITGLATDQSGLVFQQFRSLDSVGEYWIAAVDTPDGVRWVVAQTPQLEFRSSDEVLLRTRRDESPSDPEVIHLHRRQIRRCWHPDPEWPGDAYSSFRRAIPDVERYRSIARNIERTVDSRLLTNGLLWFAPDDDTKPPRPSPDGRTQDVQSVINDYVNVSHKALTDDLDFAHFVPFPMSGEKEPKFIDIGRTLDVQILAAELAALNAVGRDLDFPQQILVQGPGAGNHWSDLLLQDDFLKTGIKPRLGEVCANITLAMYRPLLKVYVSRAKLDPDRYRVWFDLSSIARRPDTSQRDMEAWINGVGRRDATGNALGLNEDELLELPAGMTEYDHWLTVHTHRSEREAGPIPSNAGPSGSPSTGPPAAPNPANSPTMTAAVTVDETDMDQTDLENALATLGPALSRIDRGLFDRLQGASEIAMVAALAEAGRRTLRLLPKGSELRAGLRDLPLEEVWFHVPPDVRASLGISEAEVLSGAFDGLSMEAQRAFDAAGASSARLVKGAGIAGDIPAVDSESAAAFLRDRLTTVAALRLADPNPPQTPGEFDPFRRVPAGAIRDALRVSSGAAHTGGVLNLDPNQRPQLPTTGKWRGGDGPASGPRVLDFIEGKVGAVSTTYEWEVGDPARPFEPHQELVGTTWTDDDMSALYNTESFPETDVYQPGDHAGCSCSAAITIGLALT